MAGKIPQQFIDDLLDRIDIVEVIGSRVPLKKAGKDFQARCPFHDEKTPSFTVSQQKQFYHCFGCGAHGSAIGFLMEYDHMGFVEAVEELASRAGVEVPHDATATTGPDNRPLYETLARAAGFYQQQLRHHPDARHAVQYLKQRGLSGEIAAEYGLGYAPPGWRNLLDHLGGSEDRLRQLRTVGMITEQEGKRYDRFRNRIMFPIRDHRGRVVGFGGRVLDDSKPKYLNSPETPVFHKGRELYGLYEARKALRQLQRLIVVEGYMDVIALAQFGIHYAVATLGTATTPDHLERLYRAAPEVVFCFDGDRAGRDAAWKALNTTLPLMRDGREARFLLLPEGEDPDTLIRKEGTAAFEERVRHGTPLSEFLFGHFAAETDMDSLDGRARLAEMARPLLERLPPGVFREMMLKKLSELIGLSVEQLSVSNVKKDNAHNPRPRRNSGRQRLTPVRRAVVLLLRDPRLANLNDLPENWRQLDAPGITLLSELLDLVRKQPNLKSAQLIEHWRETEYFPHLETLGGLAMELPVPEEGAASEFRGALMRLELQYRNQETQSLLRRVECGVATQEEKRRLKRLLSRK
ncbi:MAG TPA: DNA primase [Chromatiales bacterium]|nr:DNA primase [Chromatiales bacterium]